MLSLFLVVQSQIAGRPSGAMYVTTLAVTAVIAGIVVALIASRFDRPSSGSERQAAKIEGSRSAGDRVPSAPERARSR